MLLVGDNISKFVEGYTSMIEELEEEEEFLPEQKKIIESKILEELRMRRINYRIKKAAKEEAKKEFEALGLWRGEIQK